MARIEVAIVKFAAYNKNASTNAEWWPGALADPAGKAQAMAWELALNPVIADAVDTSGITDEAIQAAVEAIALTY